MESLYELSYHKQTTVESASPHYKLCAQSVDENTAVAWSSSKTREDLDLMLGIVDLKFEDLGDTTDGPASNLPQITRTQVMALDLTIEEIPDVLT